MSFPKKEEIFQKLGLKWLTIPMGILITSTAGAVFNLPTRFSDYIDTTPAVNAQDYMLVMVSGANRSYDWVSTRASTRG